MTEIQTSVLRLIQAMFDAAPNAAILDELSSIVEDSSGSIVPLAKLLADNPVFSSEMYSNSLSNAAFSEAFIENIVGDTVSATNKAFAANEATKLLDSGMSRGELIALVAEGLPTISADDPDWGAAAEQFRNKVEVAGAYAIDEAGSGATFDTLQAVTASVTDASESVVAAIRAFTEPLEGVVVDGYVAGATVFVDINGNGVQDSGEPSTTTDAQGNFSFPDGANNFGNIVSTGGTDIATGQPFEGSLTAPAGSDVVNPLTTLIDAISKTPGNTVASARAQVLTALGLDANTDLQKFDPIATAADPNATAEQKALALKVQAAAAQINTIVQQTAAVLQGTGTSADSNSAAAAAYAAVADAISVASASAGLSTDPNDPDSPVSDGTLNLTSSNSIGNIVKAAATKAGGTASQQAAVDSLANDASTIITNLNSAIGTAVGDGTGDVTETLNGIAQVQVVSGNTASTVQTQTSGLGNISNVVTSTSGDNLTNAIEAAASEIGDVDGDGVSNATTTSSGGSGGGGTPATFTVTETGGVVEFGGTATGNITVAWAGTIGDSVATFTRGGIDASVEPDFETAVAGTANTIRLATGQALELTLANATTLVPNIDAIIDGDGSIALTDASVAVGDLNSLEGDIKLDVTVDASAATTLTGSAINFDAAIANANITLSGSYAATVTGTPTVARLNTIDGDTSGVITATPAAATLAALNALTGSGNAYTLVITDAGTVAAADLTTLDGKTTVSIDATSAATISGTGATLSTALGSAGINTAAGVALSVTGSITTAQQATLDGSTTATITATISDGDMATLAGIADANTNNALTITVSDTSVDAAALNSLDGKTSVNVDATGVTTLTGAGAAIDTAINAATIDTAAAVNATVSDTIAATLAADIASATSGTVTATVTADDASSLESDLSGESGAFTLTVTGVANPADLNALDTLTSVTVDASGISSLSGSTANTLTAIAGDITLPGNVPVTLTDSPSVVDANTIDAATTGVITATFAPDTLASFSALSGTGNAYTVTINDAGTVAAADLNTLDGKTTVAIDATSVSTISGTGVDLSTALGSAGINTAAGVALSVSGSITTAQEATLDGSTTAAVTATISDGDMATLAGLTDANGNNALTVTVTDTSVDAAALNALDGKTTVQIDATAVTTLTGTAAAIDTALNSAGLSLSGTLAVSVDSGITTSVQQASFDGKTTGAVTATIADNDLATLSSLTDANDNNVLTVTVTDATASASALNTLDDKTSVTVTASAVSTITGSAADIITALGSAGLTLSSSISVTPDAGTMTATELTTIEAATTGDVDLSNITSITLADSANVNFEAASFDGVTLDLNGTGDNGFEFANVNLAAGGEIADLSGVTVDVDDVLLTINGNTGDDTITAPDVDTNIDAGAGADTISGGAGLDLIDAGAGADTVTGGADSDNIDLGAADGDIDTVVQAANDSADTGAIDNSISGGGAFADGDAIDITGADIVQSFEDGTDLISLSAAVSAATQDSADADGGVGVGEFTALRGDFFGLFTVDSTFGLDMLILYDASGSGDIEMLYLPGAGGATITADDFTTGGGGGGGSSFTVTETAGVVEFGGTATGNITVAWAGTVGNSVATFTRGGEDAVTTPAFSGTAHTITLAAGQSLAMSLANANTTAAALTDIDGDGSIIITDATVAAADLNTLDGAATATVDASAATTLTGTAAAVATAVTAPEISLDLGVGVTLDAGSASASDIDTIESNTTADVNMSAVTDVTLAAADSFSFDGTTVTGETFNLTGAGDNGGESFIVNNGPSGGTVDLSNITVDSNDVTVTFNGNSGIDEVTATSAADTINLDAGADKVTGGSGADTIDLGSSDAAADRVIQGAGDSADTGAISDVSGGGGVFADNDTISTTGADVVSNFEDGTDLIKLSIDPSAATQDVTVGDGGVGTSEFTAIRGNNSGGTFTVDTSSGADLLVLYDADGSGDIEMLVLAGSGGITFDASDFAQGAQTLDAATAAGTGLSEYHIEDTSTAMAALAAGVLNAAINITTTDTATVAQATTLEAATNSGSTNLASISDTAANIAGSSNAVLELSTGTVTATGNASVSQASSIAAFATAVVYSISDVAANIAAGAGLNEAVNITITDDVDIAEATIIESAANTGTKSVATITDSAANIAGSSNDVIANSAGAVTANTNATVAQANTIAAFATAVVYSVSDVAANIAAGSGLNEAINITITDDVDIAEATIVENATNSGTNSLATITDSAANIAASTNAVIANSAGAVTANTDATVSQGNTIAGFATSVVFAVEDTVANLTGEVGGLSSATSVTAVVQSGDTDLTDNALDNDVSDIDLNGETVSLTVAQAGLTITPNGGTYSVSGSVSALTGDQGDLSGATSVTVVLATGGADANISGIALDNDVGVIDLNSENATMTRAQHGGFTTIIAGGGADEITLTTAGAVTLDSAIETYSVVENSTITVGAAASGFGGINVNETGSNGDVTSVTLGTGAYTGTWTDFDVTDQFLVVNGTDISGATGLDTVAIDFNSGSGTLTVDAVQLAGLSYLNSGGINTIAVSEAATFTANAAIESYTITGASNITVNAATSVTGADGSGQTVTVGGNTVTGTYALGTGTDVISATSGADISGVNSGAATTAESLTLGFGATITLTAAQNNDFSGTITAPGSETIVVTGDGAITTLANIENYIHGDDTSNARTITVTAGNTNVSATSASDAITFDLGSLTYTGTIDGENTNADTLSLDNNADIDGSFINNVVNLTLASGATVTMSRNQHAAFSGTVSATGSQTINITGDGDVTTLADVESYSIGDDSTNSRTVTVSAAGTMVSATADDAVTFDLGSLIYTGTITGEGTTDDTLELADNANISGGSVINVEALTLATDADVTMTRLQHEGFTGAVSAGGTAESITLTTAGTFTGLAGIESYILGGSGSNTITLGANVQNVTTAAVASNQTINTGSITLYVGTITGNATDTTVLEIGTDGTDISSATLNIAAATGVEVLAQDSNGVTLNSTQHADLMTISATDAITGTGTITIDTNGTITADASPDAYILTGLGVNTITLAASDQNVTTSVAGANQTVNLGTLSSYTGTLIGNGTATDILTISTNATDISTATLVGVDQINLANDVDATMTKAFHDLINIGTGDNTVTFTDAVTGAANVSSVVETFVLAAGANSLTTTTAAQSINADALIDAQVLTMAGSTTASISLLAGDLSAAAFSDVLTVTATTGSNEITTGSAADVIDAGAGNDVISAGAGANNITTGTGSDTVNLVVPGALNATANADTITDFTTTSDKLSFDGITVTGGGAIAATSGTLATSGAVVAGALTDDSVYVVTNGGAALTLAGSETIASYTDLTDVAAYLNEGYTSTADDDAAIFVINNGSGTAYAYLFDEQTAGASTIEAADIALIGIITGTVVATDIA